MKGSWDWNKIVQNCLIKPLPLTSGRHTHQQNRINRFVLDMEESSIKFLDALTELEEQVAQRASQRDMIGGDYLEI